VSYGRGDRPKVVRAISVYFLTWHYSSDAFKHHLSSTSMSLTRRETFVRTFSFPSPKHSWRRVVPSGKRLTFPFVPKPIAPTQLLRTAPPLLLDGPPRTKRFTKESPPVAVTGNSIPHPYPHTYIHTLPPHSSTCDHDPIASRQPRFFIYPSFSARRSIGVMSNSWGGAVDIGSSDGPHARWDAVKEDVRKKKMAG
jgi:hypothetical protein